MFVHYGICGHLLFSLLLARLGGNNELCELDDRRAFFVRGSFLVLAAERLQWPYIRGRGLGHISPQFSMSPYRKQVMQ